MNFFKKIGENLRLKINTPVLNELENIQKNLNFLINHTVDINTVKTKPSVKTVQLNCFYILENLIPLLEENNIQIFAFGGTLLGAIRHKGFIPWDDDIDMGIIREDYEKLLEIKDKLKLNGLVLSSVSNKADYYSKKGFDKIYDSSLQYSVSICVFDLINTSNIDDVIKRRNKHKLNIKYVRNKYRGKNDFRILQKKYYKFENEYLKGLNIVQKEAANDSTYLVKSLLSAKSSQFLKFNSVFPLKKIAFNVYDNQTLKCIPVPCNPEEYLNNYYGEDYMFFPKDLYPKH